MHTSVVHPVLPHQNMQVIFTDNRDKQSQVVNGKEPLILSVPNRTIILRLLQGQHVFVYPFTAIVDDTPVTLPIHTGIRLNYYKVTGPEHKTSCALAG